MSMHLVDEITCALVRSAKAQASGSTSEATPDTENPRSTIKSGSANDRTRPLSSFGRNQSQPAPRSEIPLSISPELRRWTELRPDIAFKSVLDEARAVLACRISHARRKEPSVYRIHRERLKAPACLR
jgi:hypothetical protein